MLDSETTGLTPPVQFVEIAIVEAGANTLFEDTIRPVCRIAALCSEPLRLNECSARLSWLLKLSAATRRRAVVGQEVFSLPEGLFSRLLWRSVAAAKHIGHKDRHNADERRE